MLIFLGLYEYFCGCYGTSKSEEYVDWVEFRARPCYHQSAHYILHILHGMWQVQQSLILDYFPTFGSLAVCADYEFRICCSAGSGRGSYAQGPVSPGYRCSFPKMLRSSYTYYSTDISVIFVDIVCIRHRIFWLVTLGHKQWLILHMS